MISDATYLLLINDLTAQQHGTDMPERQERYAAAIREVTEAHRRQREQATAVDPDPPAEDPGVKSRRTVIEHHYAEAYRLARTIREGSSFGSIEWKQAQLHLLQAQALEGMEHAAAVAAAREAALRGLGGPDTGSHVSWSGPIRRSAAWGRAGL